MALFKVKDLMIDVTSVQQQAICAHFTPICTALCSLQISCHFQCSFQITCHFFQTCHFGCTVIHSPITCVTGTIGPTPGCTPTFIQPDPAALKEQLKAQLAAVEAAENQLQPQTVADVDMLQQKLAEAMDALKARRVELQKK